MLCCLKIHDRLLEPDRIGGNRRIFNTLPGRSQLCVRRLDSHFNRGEFSRLHVRQLFLAGGGLFLRLAARTPLRSTIAALGPFFESLDPCLPLRIVRELPHTAIAVETRAPWWRRDSKGSDRA